MGRRALLESASVESPRRPSAMRRLHDSRRARDSAQAFIARRVALARARVGGDAPAACELLEAMLQQDPARRVTAAHALQHRFVTESYLERPAAGGECEQIRTSLREPPCSEQPKTARATGDKMRLTSCGGSIEYRDVR